MRFLYRPQRKPTPNPFSQRSQITSLFSQIIAIFSSSIDQSRMAFHRARLSKAQTSRSPAFSAAKGQNAPCHLSFWATPLPLGRHFLLPSRNRAQGGNVIRHPECCTQCTDTPGGSIFIWSLDSPTAVFPFRYSMTWLSFTGLWNFKRREMILSAVKRIERSKVSQILPLVVPLSSHQPSAIVGPSASIFSLSFVRYTW